MTDTSTIASLAKLLERYFKFNYDQTVVVLRRTIVILAAILFLIISTGIVAFDTLFPGQNSVASLEVGDIAPFDIIAPRTIEYVSDVLTQRSEATTAEAVSPIYSEPNVSIGRQQRTVAQQILAFIQNIRRDPYATIEQKANDLVAIRDLTLDEEVITRILTIDTDTWRDVDEQIIVVLELVMQDEIRETELEDIRRQLPTRVSLRVTDQQDIDVIAEIVSDLMRPNTALDQVATDQAITDAINSLPPERRAFERNQIVVNARSEILEEDYEALQQLGLLEQSHNRAEELGQAFLSSVIVMVIIGLYIAQFQPNLLYSEPRFLTLLASIFLIILFGARFGLNEQFYVYPSATMALLYVAIIGPQVAFIAVLGLALLIGIMSGLSLEFTTLVAAGGIIAILSLKRSERINNFFVAGLMVAIINMGVAAIFNLNSLDAETNGQILVLLAYGFVNGILTAAATVAALYIISALFNLPTALKLADLSQPNQPLLQRLLRETPGTYQHSLQVANLGEQAATAINANAELVHVAALYHDIGKMLNPAFFSENQRDSGNPHDTLNDPYRSADIIISHVTGGDDLARQYRLPVRLRDFIREHHGTSQVYVFYRQAVILAGDDESAVDISEFTYPGPKPQSRETAILMLADSCESAVRAKQPKTKKDTEDTVLSVIEGKRKSGQLDESNLTLNDLNNITHIFIEMLQAIYHPRVDYNTAVERVREQVKAGEISKAEAMKKSDPKLPKVRVTSTNTMESVKVVNNDDDDDDKPLAEVPRLRRMRESTEDSNAKNNNNTQGTQATPKEDEPNNSEKPAE